MSRKIPWPFIVVILTSFALGAAWGWKLIQDRAAAAGQLVSEAKLRVLSPPGLFSRELLIEFQRREKIEVEVATEHFPGSLLRRALKSAPGQYDVVIAYHYQVSALRGERKMMSPYDARLKFPIAISPDFRKLPDDRNLMDTTPILWGLLGIVSLKSVPSAPMAGSLSKASFQIASWPSLAIGTDPGGSTPAAYASKLQTQIASSDEFEKSLQLGPGAPTSKLSSAAFAVPQLISHASLEFGPLKEISKDLELRGLTESPRYPLWILTAVAMMDGDLERIRKFQRFLLEPKNNVTMINYAGFGATTLRDSEELNVLPKPLRSSHFRTFPIDQILVEKDERVRLADEALEQLIRGADVRNVVRPTPTPRPTPKPVTVKAPIQSPPPDTDSEPSATEKSEPQPESQPATKSETHSDSQSDSQPDSP